jgi:hypothetical protein
MLPGDEPGIAVDGIPSLFIPMAPADAEPWRSPDGFTLLEELRSYLDALDSFGNLVPDSQAARAFQRGTAAGFYGDVADTGEQWLYVPGATLVAFVCGLGLACDTTAELHGALLPELVRAGVLHGFVHRLQVLGLGQVHFYALRCVRLWPAKGVAMSSDEG